MHIRVVVLTALSVVLTCGAAAKNATPVAVPLPQGKPLNDSGKEKQPHSKPAMVLFSEKKLPSLGSAMAIGYYPSGCLQGGVELPITGPTWQVMRVYRNRNWGQPILVEFLERFSTFAAQATCLCG